MSVRRKPSADLGGLGRWGRAHTYTLLGGLGLAALAAAAAVTFPQPARGYAIEVHKDFYDHAFLGSAGTSASGRSVAAPTQADLEAFRRFVYERSASNQSFRARYPSFAEFDAAAFKEFLALNPHREVVGIDIVPAGRPLDVRTVVREGSVDPDNDHRNRERLFVENGQVTLDAFGRAVPYDPLTVWFGGLTGTPSQFDAHGATPRDLDYTSSKAGAFLHPERFADPARAMGSAPEFSQSYTDLAMLAHLWGGPGSEWLALSFAGNNMHGLEDLGNQIHTTVLGTRGFMVDALITHSKNKVRNMFRRRADPAAAGFTAPGSLTPAEVEAAMVLIDAGNADQVDPQVRWALGKEPTGSPDLTALGILIIGNHHRLLEDFVQLQYLDAMAKIRAGRASEVDPVIRGVIDQARQGDAAFEQACRQALGGAGLGTGPEGTIDFAQVLAEVMIDHSHPEAAQIYDAIRKLSDKDLQRGGTYDDRLGHDPLDFVSTHQTSDRHVREVWDLSGRAFARVVTILRLWEDTFQQQVAGVTPGSAEALARADLVTERLVNRQLTYLDEAAQRRADYLAKTQADYDDAQKPGLVARLRGLFGR
jgi:hypothetical protein